MTDTNKKGAAILIAAIAALAIWSFSRRPTAVQVAVEETVSNPFTEPYYQTNPGVQDVSTTGGLPPFQSDLTVNVYADPLAGISNKYIPMFGFVGVAAIGS